MPTISETQAGRPVLSATFFVRDTLCALDAGGVQEVIRVGALTPVPYAPVDLLGIVNLRGRIVSIFDLGLRLGFPPSARGADSRIFILEDRGEFIGLLVDRVDEVVEIESNQWQPPPANVASGHAKYFKAVCQWQGRVIALLDASQILAEAGSDCAGPVASGLAGERK